MMGAGNVTRAAGAGAVRLGRLDARLDHLGMAAHAKVIVGAPHRHFAANRIVAAGPPHRERKSPSVALEVGKHAIALLALQPFDRSLKAALIIHRLLVPFALAPPRQADAGLMPKFRRAGQYA